MVPALVVLIIFFSFVLISSSDMVITALRRISRSTNTRVFALSAVVLAVGTSLPEFFVGFTAALEGVPSVSLGDVVGSNIANIALIGGLASFFVGRVAVRGDYLKREVGIALAAGMLPAFLFLDNKLGRVDGLILLAVYMAYTTSFFKARYAQIGKEQQEESFFYRFIRKFDHISASKKREYARLFIGLALLLFSADWIVKIAEYLANLVHVPQFVIGLIIVAIGTSLPELAFSFRSLGDHEPQMFFGNLLGSTIANSTLILGMVSFLHPIELVAPHKYFISVGVFVVVFLAFWVLVRTKHRLDRWESAVLLTLYVIFVIAELM